jgi:hypothetical protein
LCHLGHGMRAESSHYVAVSRILGIFRGYQAFPGQGCIGTPGPCSPIGVFALVFHLGFILSHMVYLSSQP